MTLRAPSHFLFSAAITILLPAHAHAQQPLSVDPSTVLSEARKAYHTAPTAERITITLKNADRLTRTETILYRSDPGAPSTTADDVIAMEFGPLRLHAMGGTLSVWHSSHPATLYRATYEQPLTPAKLARLLPPLAAPQLAISSSQPDDDKIDLLPTAPAVHFDKAEGDPKAAHPVWTLTGQGARGAVTMFVDGATGRLQRILSREKNSPISLEMAIDPLNLTPSSTWSVDPTGRRLVSSLAELTSPAPMLRVGDPWPAATMTSLQGAEVPLDQCFPRGDGPAFAMLIVVGDAAAETIDPEPKASPDNPSLALALSAAQLTALGRVGVGLTPILLINQALAENERAKLLTAMPNRWPALHDQNARLLLSPTRRTLLRRLIPDGNVAIVLLDANRTLRAIVAVDARTDEADAIVAELRMVLPVLPTKAPSQP